MAVGALGATAAGTTATADAVSGGGVVDKRVQRLAAALLSQAVVAHSPQVGDCNAGGSDNDSQNNKYSTARQLHIVNKMPLL